MEPYIVVNKIQCNNCKDIIQSIHRHDFKMCSCNSVGIYGGTGYFRRIGENYTDMSLENTDPIEIIREHMYWGRNYNSKKELLPQTEWILLKYISDDHLDALLVYLKDKKFSDVFEKEKQYRDGNI